MTALLTHYGHWVQPPRRQAQGPAPKPRWMPLPGLLYARVVQTVRRWHLVCVSHGRCTDRSRVDAAGRAALSGTAMATAAGGVSGGAFVDHEDEWITCAFSQGQRSPSGLGNPM